MHRSHHVTATLLLLAFAPAGADAQRDVTHQRVRVAEGLGAFVSSRSSIAGTRDETIEAGGESRHYVLHLPASRRPGVPMPLVVAFHGLGGTGAQQELMSGLSRKSEEQAFIVVYPDGLGHMWRTATRANATADLAFVRALVRDVSARFPVDPRRVYATGMSNGGGMTNRVACDMADVFAAVAAVSGGYVMSDSCNPSRPIAVMAIHGTADPLVPYEGRRREPTTPAVLEWATQWGVRDGCLASADRTGDAAAVETRRWMGCRGGSEIVLHTVAGMGHEWPGGEGRRRIWQTREPTRLINATNEVWDFLQSHSMR